MKKKIVALALGCASLLFLTGCAAEALAFYALLQLPGVTQFLGDAAANLQQ